MYSNPVVQWLIGLTFVVIGTLILFNFNLIAKITGIL